VFELLVDRGLPLGTPSLASQRVDRAIPTGEIDCVVAGNGCGDDRTVEGVGPLGVAISGGDTHSGGSAGCVDGVEGRRRWRDGVVADLCGPQPGSSGGIGGPERAGVLASVDCVVGHHRRRLGRLAARPGVVVGRDRS